MTIDFPAKEDRPRPVPSRRLLVDGVYDAVKERIMDLTIPEDTRINIDQLADELEVSNTPVREALTRLEREGLVTRKNLHGFRTTGLLDERGLQELFALRLLLEPEAAKEAAGQSDIEALAKHLGDALDKMAHSVHAPVLDHEYSRYRGFAEADARFHAGVAAASGNRLLAYTLAGLNAHVHSYRLFFRTEIYAVTLAEHSTVLEALARRDPGGAAAAMRLHLEHSRDRLIQGVRSTGPAEGENTRPAG
jgi:DNA-binding GntR family transcriptional regulator